MADFGVEATTLSAPQGAGTQAIPAVQEQAVTVNPMGLLDNVVDVWNKVTSVNKKEEAEKRKNAVIASYVRAETSINDAVVSGQMPADQAAARSRANANKHAASYPEFIGEFKTAADALRGITERGEVEEKIKNERELRKTDIKQAQERGYTFYPGMSASAEDAQIRAAKTGIQLETQQRIEFAKNSEARANGTYNQGVADREQKNNAMTIINSLAGGNMDAFHAVVTDAGGQVRSGKMDPAAAQAAITQQYTKIQAAIQAAAGTNPELAGTYRTLFDDVYKLGMKLTDPKDAAENVSNQLKLKVDTLKLMAVSSNPRIAGAVALSQLLPMNTNLALASTKESLEILATVSQMAATDKSISPQIVGNTDAEADVLKLLSSSLDGLKTGKAQNKDIAAIQAGNSLNQVLKQTGDYLDRGLATPQNLKGLAAFFASPSYASAVKDGLVSAESQQTAKKAFQMVYEPAVVNGVQKVLAESYTVNTGLVANRAASGATLSPTTKAVSELVAIKFDGTGVVFDPQPGFSGLDRDKQRNVLETLKVAQKSVTQLVHLGAHLEGTTDYAKFWEANKHIYLPNMFSKYKGLEIGQVVQGMRYKGGDAQKQSNWEAVN